MWGMGGHALSRTSRGDNTLPRFSNKFYIILCHTDCASSHIRCSKSWITVLHYSLSYRWYIFPSKVFKKLYHSLAKLIKVFWCVFGRLCNGDERQQKVLSAVSFIPLLLKTNGANSNKQVITVQRTSLKPIV